MVVSEVIGLPSVSIHFHRMFPNKNHPASYWGTTMAMDTSVWSLSQDSADALNSQLQEEIEKLREDGHRHLILGISLKKHGGETMAIRGTPK